jgi:signal transduction histidine kinase
MPEETPLERLIYFQEQVGIGPEDFRVLAAHRELFTSQEQAFGRRFWEYFWEIDRTRQVLEHDRARRLEKVLGRWFGRLFSEELSPGFLAYLWSSGLKHVQANLDQRYINLGYAMARDFCQPLVAQAPAADRQALGRAVDKLLDFCVLVATDSYLSVTSRCDRQVIQGIAHQVRNPVTVIGGYIRRLQRRADRHSEAWQAYQTVLEENMRLERMVGDISDYTRLFQTDPAAEPVVLEPVLREALRRARQTTGRREVAVELVSGDGLAAYADPQDLATMFRHLAENCLEAAKDGDPRVVVTVRPGREGRVEVELFNTGPPPPAGELEELMSPFHSSKPLGTGFGLPIADMVARRNLGSLRLEPARGGTRCLVALPGAGA